MKINQANVTEGIICLRFVGPIDEDTKFSEIQFGKDTKALIIDLQESTRINSCGIREWIKWLGTLAENIKLTFRNCPKFIIDQMNLVEDFLPNRASVQSFYVPYYCKQCEKINTLLFDLNQNSKTSQGLPLNEDKCSQCSEVTVMDNVSGQYFQFLEAQNGRRS